MCKLECWCGQCCKRHIKTFGILQALYMDFYLYTVVNLICCPSRFLPSRRFRSKRSQAQVGLVLWYPYVVLAVVAIFSREFWTFHDIPGSFASEWSLNMTEQFQLFFFKGITFTHAVTVVRVQYSTVCMSVLKLSNWVVLWLILVVLLGKADRRNCDLGDRQLPYTIRLIHLAWPPPHGWIYRIPSLEHLLAKGAWNSTKWWGSVASNAICRLTERPRVAFGGSSSCQSRTSC